MLSTIASLEVVLFNLLLMLALLFNQVHGDWVVFVCIHCLLIQQNIGLLGNKLISKTVPDDQELFKRSYRADPARETTIFAAGKINNTVLKWATMQNTSMEGKSDIFGCYGGGHTVWPGLKIMVRHRTLSDRPWNMSDRNDILSDILSGLSSLKRVNGYFRVLKYY